MMRVVDDDALHIENAQAPGTTICGQQTTPDTNLGTYDELRASRGMDCWTCHDLYVKRTTASPTG